MKNKYPANNQEPGDQREDSLIEESLSSLKALEIPSGLRDSNRQRIEQVLAEVSKAEVGLRYPWWRRRVVIPLPVAAGFIIAFGLLITGQIAQVNWGDKTTPVRYDKTEVIRKSSPERPAQNQDKLYYHEAGIYVAGIGLVEKEYGHNFFQENSHENN